MKKVFRIFTIAAIAFGMSMTVACTDDSENSGGNGGNNTPTTTELEMDLAGIGNGELPEGWISIDADGDGYGWYCVTFEGYTRPCLLSYSWYSQVALTPDNYLVSPEFNVPNTGYKLTWDVAAQDPDWPEEYYAVYIGTLSNGVFVPINEVFNETLASGDFESRSVSLDNFKGQTVRVAFRHYNTTDMFAMKVDNVKVSNK